MIFDKLIFDSLHLIKQNNQLNNNHAGFELNDSCTDQLISRTCGT